MSRIIFLDVDGTLVDYEGRIPPSAVESIRRARDAGHRVYLSTGRSRAEVYPELWDIGLDGLIGANGGYVEDAGEVILHEHLTAEQCRDVVDWLRARGLEFYLESNGGLFGSEHFESAAEPVIRRYVSGSDELAASSLTVRDAFPDMIFGQGLHRDDVNKISFILGSPQDQLDATAAFPDLQSGTWGGRGNDALFGDLGVAGVSKKHAVDVLLNHRDADLADTIAFGDAAVDIPMLTYCAIGVAMGNGSAEVKAVADHITTEVTDDGLLRAFEHLGLLAPA